MVARNTSKFKENLHNPKLCRLMAKCTQNPVRSRIKIWWDQLCYQGHCNLEMQLTFMANSTVVLSNICHLNNSKLKILCLQLWGPDSMISNCSSSHSHMGSKLVLKKTSVEALLFSTTSNQAVAVANNSRPNFKIWEFTQMTVMKLINLKIAS